MPNRLNRSSKRGSVSRERKPIQKSYKIEHEYAESDERAARGRTPQESQSRERPPALSLTPDRSDGFPLNLSQPYRYTGGLLEDGRECEYATRPSHQGG